MSECDRLLAVLPVREGTVPPGVVDAMVLARGSALVVGEGACAAAQQITAASVLRCVDVPDFRPSAIAAALVPLLTDVDCVIIPACAEGRSIAARLAFLLCRSLWPNVAWWEGNTAVSLRADGSIGRRFPWDSVRGVVTVRPGAVPWVSDRVEGCDHRVLPLSLPEEPDARSLGVLPGRQRARVRELIHAAQ